MLLQTIIHVSFRLAVTGSTRQQLFPLKITMSHDRFASDLKNVRRTRGYVVISQKLRKSMLDKYVTFDSSSFVSSRIFFFIFTKFIECHNMLQTLVVTGIWEKLFGKWDDKLSSTSQWSRAWTVEAHGKPSTAPVQIDVSKSSPRELSNEYQHDNV